jgi:hypothetical protein
MAKPRGVDAKLKRLRALRRETAVPGHVVELRRALNDVSNLVVGDAAEIVAEQHLSELAADLVAAFDRFLVDPVETDKLCRAKLAIVETLNAIEYDREEIFLRAIRHVQMEPRWGREEDSAAGLRGVAAFGLVRINYHDVAVQLADLLADPEKPARLAAVKALGASAAPAAVPLLRFKARIGDSEPEVTAECLAALMSAAPVESLPFVAGFLAFPNDVIQAGAAFALAESRRTDALDILVGHWPRARRGSLEEILLLAISITRLPAALEFLLGILADEHQTAASAALSALAIHSHNESLRERIATIVARRADPALREQFDRKFDAKK